MGLFIASGEAPDIEIISPLVRPRSRSEKGQSKDLMDHQSRARSRARSLADIHNQPSSVLPRGQVRAVVLCTCMLSVVVVLCSQVLSVVVVLCS